MALDEKGRFGFYPFLPDFVYKQKPASETDGVKLNNNPAVENSGVILCLVLFIANVEIVQFFLCEVHFRQVVLCGFQEHEIAGGVRCNVKRVAAV